MRQEIRDILMAYAEEEYRDFSAHLIPDSKPLLGIRLPKLHEIAKDMVKHKDWRTELQSYEGEYTDLYFEEIMLRGMMIGVGTQKKDASIEEALQMTQKFIPYIDNWSICDSFCNGLKIVSKHQDICYPFIEKLVYSEKEFEARVGIILLLNQYLKFDKQGKKVPRKRVITVADMEKNETTQHFEQFPYLESMLGLLNQSFPQGYYTKMAAAWTIAEAFVCFPYEVTQLLNKDCRLDEETRKKAIRKICESKTPDADVKQKMKELGKS